MGEKKETERKERDNPVLFVDGEDVGVIVSSFTHVTIFGLHVIMTSEKLWHS